MNKKISLLILISSLILSLSSVKAMLIFPFDDRELQTEEQRVVNHFDLSVMGEELEEIATEILSPHENQIPNPTKKPENEKTHIRRSSDGRIYDFEIYKKEKTPESFVVLQIICASFGIDFKLLKDANTIYKILQKKYDEILTQICSPSEILAQEQLLSLILQCIQQNLQ